MVRAPGRAAVEGVTVILLTRPGGPVVDAVLDALQASRVPPRQVLVSGLPTEGEEARRALGHPIVGDGVEVRCAPPVPEGPSPYAAQVAQALELLPRDRAQWVWLLLDGSTPRSGALGALLEPARRSGRVGVVGPKLLRADDPRTVVAVGHRLSRSGRPVETTPIGWVDQGQLDDRTDVLGVPLPGMLVRSDVLAEVGGIDRGLGAGTEGLDLSWRTHLCGHRVLVAPAAEVELDGTVLDGIVLDGTVLDGIVLDGPGTGSHRRRVRQVALARTSWWSAPFRALGVAVTSVLAFLALLLLRRPRAALTELGDLGAVLSPGPGLGARWRFRGRRRVADRDLAGLFASRRTAWRSTWEGMQEPPRAGGPGPATAGGARPGVETGPVSDESAAPDATGVRRWWSPPLVAALAIALGVLLARWRDLLAGLDPDGFGVRGAELGTTVAGSTELWWAWALPWSGEGLGGPGSGPPWLLPLAGLAWVAEHLPGGPGATTSAAVGTTWLLAGSVPLSVLTAYLALRPTTPRRLLRATGALAFAMLAPLTVATDEGRLGPAVVHVLAPLLLAALVRAADRRPGTRGGSPAWGAALLLAAGSWWVPSLALWALPAALVVGVAARGPARLGALVVAVVPVALWGPWLLQVLQTPWLLAGGAGATTVAQAPPGWQLVLLHPGGPLDPTLWWSVPLWLLALAAPAVRGGRGRRATLALVLAALALGVALLAPLSPYAVLPGGFAEAGSAVSLWPGTYLSLGAAGALLAAVVAADALLSARAARRVAAAPRGRRAGAALAAGIVLVGVAGVAVLGITAWRGLSTPGGSLEVADRPVPVVASQQAAGPTGARLLTLVPVGEPSSYAVRYRLSGVEPGVWVRDRARELTRGRAQISDAVADVADSGSEPGAEVTAAAALRDLAVGYLLVPVGSEHPLAQALQLIPGVVPVAGPEQSTLWRVAPAPPTGVESARITALDPARITALDRAGAPLGVVPMAGPHGRTRASLPDGSASVVISQPPRWAEVASVTADGQTLTAAPDPAVPVAYDLPPGARELVVDLSMGHRAWWVGTAAAALLVAFLVLPPGGPRTRRSG